MPDSLGVGGALLLVVEAGPHAEPVRHRQLLRPQAVPALGAGNVRRPIESCRNLGVAIFVRKSPTHFGSFFARGVL
jgi:hypothetical protein